MPPLDIGPAPELWLPPRPAIIRPAAELWKPPAGVELASFLPGTFPAGLLAAAGGIELAFRDSATSTGATIVVPNTVQAGDLAFLTAYSNGSNPAQFSNSGWSTLDYSSYFNDRSQIDYRILTGSEAGLTINVFGGFSTRSAVMLVFSGGISAINLSARDEYYSNGNPPSQTVAAAGGAAPLVVLAVLSGTSTANFSTESPAFDGSVITSNSRTRFGYGIYNASPQNHTVDANDLGNATYLSSWWVECS